MKTLSGFSNAKSKGDLYRTPNILTRLLLSNIESYTYMNSEISNELIIDPCAGYGDILKEVKPLCRGVIGIDIEPRGEGITKGDFFTKVVDINPYIKRVEK